VKILLMKPYKVLFPFFILLMVKADAQKWFWARQAFGNATYSEGIATATDGNDNVYLVGSWGPGPKSGKYVVFGNDTLRTWMTAGSVGYLVKYDSSGNFLWSTESNGSCFPYSIATDKKSNIYETGFFSDTVSFGVNTLITKNNNIYLVKYSQNGSVLWARAPTAKSSNINISFSTAIDTDNNVYITGSFEDTVIFGAYVLVSKGFENVFLAKYDSNGNVLWAYAYGGKAPNGDASNGVIVDGENNPIIVGAFSSPAIQFGSVTLMNYGVNNIFLAKFDENGNALWAASSKVTNTAQGYCVATDKNNNVYFSGNYSSASIVLGNDSFSIYQGQMFIAKYSSSGKEIWVNPVKSVGPDANPVIWTIVTDYCNDVYISGGCGDSLIIDNFKYTAPAGYSDPAFVAELDSNGSLLNCFVTNTGGDDWAWITLNSRNDIYFGGDIEINTYMGDSLYYINDENAFLSKFTFGPPSCCKISSVRIVGSTSIIAGDSVLISSSVNGSSYLWSTGATTKSIVIKPSATSTYSLSVKDSAGCINSAVIVITVTENCGNIFIPTAFSPNKNGQNDILYVHGDCIKAMDFVVYDRWGEKVFESYSLNDGWDGTFKGKPLNTGSFAYYLKATMQNGKVVEKKGNVALVR